MFTSEKLLISVRRLLDTPISYGSLKFFATYLAKLPSPARPSSLLATLSAKITQDSRVNPFDCGIISISCEALSQIADFLIGLSPSRLSFSISFVCENRFAHLHKALKALLLHTAAHTPRPDKLEVECLITDSKHSWGTMSNPADSANIAV